MRGKRRRTRLGGALAAAVVTAVACPAAAVSAPPPANPWTAPNGAATMHGDTASSDTTPLAGPPEGAWSVRHRTLFAACPAILLGTAPEPLALCTGMADRAPVVHLLDAASGRSRASLRLRRGGLFGGVYAYLDHRDRLVATDGGGDLVRVARAWERGRSRLRVDERVSLGPAVADACGDRPGCAAVVGISPDWQGRVWFATAGGVVGFAAPGGAVRAIALPAGERIDNSISTAPAGTAVATGHALYLLRAGAEGAPEVAWRASYDRGPSRRPGQLSWGTGATPTFFGPDTGADFLTITDNAHPLAHVLVHDVRDGRLVCREPFLDAARSGTENSPIGIDRSVIVASTYGYPYPAYPPGAGPSEPWRARFAGGIARIDLDADGDGCATRWTSPLASAAVPKLSLADGRIHTVTRGAPFGLPSPLDPFDAVSIDAETGERLTRRRFGAGLLLDPLQLAGQLGPGGVAWQGTISGVARISRRGP